MYSVTVSRAHIFTERRRNEDNI